MEIKRLDLGMVNAYLVKTQNGNFLIDTGIAMGRPKLLESSEKGTCCQCFSLSSSAA